MLLSPHLDFSTGALPPPGSNLIITDTLTETADVAVFHLVIAAIQSHTPIIWVDFRSDPTARWETILRRFGTTLPKNPKLFTHIQPSPTDATPHLFESGGLDATYNVAIAAIPKAKSLVVLDVLGDLTDIGFEAVEVSRFVRAMLAVTRERGGMLVSTLHADDFEADWGRHELLDRLLRLGGGWWRVEGMSTGRSADVSGEISAFALEPGGEGMPVVTKDKALQYRLEVGSVKVFAKGTGRGYL